jgi:hypothetical protein
MRLIVQPPFYSATYLERFYNNTQGVLRKALLNGSLCFARRSPVDHYYCDLTTGQSQYNGQFVLALPGHLSWTCLMPGLE